MKLFRILQYSELVGGSVSALSITTIVANSYEPVYVSCSQYLSILSALHAFTASIVILLAGNESEAQRGQGTCPSSHNQYQETGTQCLAQTSPVSLFTGMSVKFCLISL